MIAQDDDAELERLAGIRRKTLERQARRKNLEVVHIADAPDADRSDKRQYHLGFSNIDRRLGILRPGGFTLLCAVSGMGKTIIAEQIAVSNATAGETVMFATLEMTKEDIKLSIMARLMGLSLEDVERHQAVTSEAYLAALDKINDLPLFLWRPQPRQPRTAEVILRAAAEAQASMLIVDYTRHISGWEPGNKASAITETFSASIKESKLHLIMLAQLKLDSHGKRPGPADVEDTKRLYQEADKVLFLHRPFFNRDERKDTVSEIITSKNRRGKVFIGYVHWTGEVRSFAAMSEEEEARAFARQNRTAAKTPKAAKPKEEPPLAQEIESTLFDDSNSDDGYWPTERD